MSEIGIAGPSDRDLSDRKRRGRRRLWVWVAIGGGTMALVACVGIVLLGVLVAAQDTTPGWGVGSAVGVIYIEGPIGVVSTGSGPAVDSATIIDYVSQAEANPRVKAIVVYINSPGGAVVPSDVMYRALRDATKPVVAVMGDVAASGGYYVACGADKILAHPATITGSIGVYGQLINAADLLDELGIEVVIVRSGDSKAIGNWFEHPTREQIAIEQAIVDELHDLFVRVVVESRGMLGENVRALADGRPYTGRQAMELGLVDDLGTLEDAIREAGRMGGISGEPSVIKYRRSPTLLEAWLGTTRTLGSDLDVMRWLLGRVALPEMRYVSP